MEIKKIFKSEIFVTLAIIIISLFLYKSFEVNGNFQKIVATVSFFFLIPILYIRIILKRSLNEFGLQKGDWKAGLKYSALSFLILMPIIYILFNNLNFIEKYYIPVSNITSFKGFVFREVVVVSFFIALYEFFFRGFIMFYFLNKIKSGFYANVIQFLAFCAFLFFANSFTWAVTPYIIMAPLVGIISMKSRSILYSFVFSWISILLIDSVFIKLVINSVLQR